MQSKVQYTVEYKKKRKNITIIISRDGLVTVRAPEWVDCKAIESLIEKKSKWIRKKQEEFELLPKAVCSLKYQSGDTIYVLGRAYRLKFAYRKSPKVSITHDELLVEYPGFALEGKELNESLQQNSDNYLEKRKMYVRKWFKDQAGGLFTERLNYWITLMGLEKQLVNGQISVRCMKSRWGSCNAKGTIQLNMKLYCMNIYLIDYVIVHELCHLVHFNHGKSFYSMLTSVMPDWKERKKEIESRHALWVV